MFFFCRRNPQRSASKVAEKKNRELEEESIDDVDNFEEELSAKEDEEGDAEFVVEEEDATVEDSIMEEISPKKEGVKKKVKEETTKTVKESNVASVDDFSS